MSEKWTTSKDSGIPITVTQPDDPAYFLLTHGPTSSTTVYHRGCYICEDPEFAQMGMPLCRECPRCRAEGREAPAPDRGFGHIPADDETCTVCGYNDREAWEAEEARHES